MGLNDSQRVAVWHLADATTVNGRMHLIRARVARRFGLDVWQTKIAKQSKTDTRCADKCFEMVSQLFGNLYIRSQFRRAHFGDFGDLVPGTSEGPHVLSWLPGRTFFSWKATTPRFCLGGVRTSESHKQTCNKTFKH